MKLSDTLKLSSNVYNALKFISTVLVPSLVTLVGTIGTTLGFVEETKIIIVIIMALGTFVGALIGLSSDSHKYEAILSQYAPLTVPVSVPTVGEAEKFLAVEEENEVSPKVMDYELEPLEV